MLYRKCFKTLLDFIIALTGFYHCGYFTFVANNGRPFFFQPRPGLHEKIFKVIKFKTMSDKKDADGNLLPDADRLTGIGKFVRKTSLDEIPQLLNVIAGKMSLVGPRPELPRYVSMYDDHQKKVLDMKSGITDMASIQFKNENEILSQQTDPETYYINHIMPRKIEINLHTASMSQSAIGSLKIILLTVIAIFKK